MQLLMVRFDEQGAAREALERLKDAAGGDGVELDDLALVFKAEDGKVKVEQTRDVSKGRGAARGALLGAALGIVTGGIAAVAAAGAAGGALVASRDRGISNKVMRRIGETIEGSEAVVFVAAEPESVERITTYIDERRRKDLDYLVLSPADEAELRAALE